MRCALLAPFRVVLPDCITGSRRNSQSGVDRETPGRSTSSLRSQGSLHLSPPLLFRFAFSLTCSWQCYIFTEVLGPQDSGFVVSSGTTCKPLPPAAVWIRKLVYFWNEMGCQNRASHSTFLNDSFCYQCTGKDWALSPTRRGFLTLHSTDIP